MNVREWRIITHEGGISTRVPLVGGDNSFSGMIATEAQRFEKKKEEGVLSDSTLPLTAPSFLSLFVSVPLCLRG
jgi:hypothetical protein